MFVEIFLVLPDTSSAAFFFDVAMGMKIGLERQDGNICFSRYEAGG